MADPLSIIGLIVTLLDQAKKAYDKVQDATHLPQAFREIHGRIETANETLEEIRKKYQENTDEEAKIKKEAKIKGTLQECAGGAKDVQKMYEIVCDAADGDWHQRCRGYVSSIEHDRKSKVEDR